MTDVQIHDYESILQLDWDNFLNGDYAKNYLLNFMKNGPTYYIDNVNTQMLALTIDNLVLPVTINEAEYENSYVCSPYTHYITYALEELRLIENRFIRFCLKGIIHPLGFLFKLGKINQNIIVNNWLVSTNLYPPLSEGQIDQITQFLTSKYPQHTVLFRSINGCLNNNLIDAFKNNHYRLILSRQVYFLNTFDDKVFYSKPFKQDLKLFEKSKYRIEEGSVLSKEDIRRVVELYNKLYLNKYSLLNPQFNHKFIELAIQNNLLTIKTIRKDSNPIDGVLGYFQNNGIMTTPLFGYNTELSKETGLYRLISTVLAFEAKEKKHYLNQSSGVAQFKKVRKATPHLEYTGAYTHHLNWWRRTPWKLLHFFTEFFIVPLMKKYNL